jgi:hypothetical protein
MGRLHHCPRLAVQRTIGVSSAQNRNRRGAMTGNQHLPDRPAILSRPTVSISRADQFSIVGWDKRSAVPPKPLIGPGEYITRSCGRPVARRRLRSSGRGRVSYSLRACFRSCLAHNVNHRAIRTTSQRSANRVGSLHSCSRLAVRARNGRLRRRNREIIAGKRAATPMYDVPSRSGGQGGTKNA